MMAPVEQIDVKRPNGVLLPNTHSQTKTPTPPPPFTIKTSKKWVLPPRPKPGRKPVDSDSSSSSPAPTSGHEEKKKKKNATHTSCNEQVAQKKQQADSRSQTPSGTEPKKVTKRGRKSKAEKAKEAELANDPIRQAIRKINEENYFLKLEVIKLVSDLKSLKNENGQPQQQLESQQQQSQQYTSNESTTRLKTNDNEKQQKQDITSIPMGYNSTSNKTINNNTIYRINSNASSTNPSTPMMSHTSSSSPATDATTPPSTTMPPHGKKRAHDEDINDLVLSLVDLNHSAVTSKVSPLTSTNLNSLHQKDQFNCTNFLNFEDVASVNEEVEIESIHDDIESIDIESLTPNSLLSLSKTNSTIDDLDLSDHHSHAHSHHSHHHFSPKLIDIPEIPSMSNNTGANVTSAGSDYEFSFWKSFKETAGTTTSGELKKNLVFNTDSTLDELIMERQRERERELLNYNDFNDMLDFETNAGQCDINSSKQGHVVFNDDWKLDDDDLLNF